MLNLVARRNTGILAGRAVYSSEAAPRTDEHVGSASLGQCLIAPPPAGRRKLDPLGWDSQGQVF